MKIGLQLALWLSAIGLTLYNSFYSFTLIWVSLMGVFLCDRLVKTKKSPIKLIRYYQLCMYLTMISGFWIVCCYGSQ